MRIVLLTCAALLFAACFDEPPAEKRSVLPVAQSLMTTGPAKFDRAKSAAIFIGIRKFDDPSIDHVPFAVDDAIDLAYAFALERRIGLVKARNVVLVLSGAAQKPESEKRLKALEAAGAEIRRTATRADILSLLQRQAELAAEGGVLIVSIASHGFSHQGTPYILGSSSTFPDVESALSTAQIAQIAGDAKARRSFLFLDACRERVQPGQTRALGPDPRSAAPLITRMSKHEGQVIFFAAANGNYAFDDFERQNGVFTGAVLDALRCSTTRDAHGIVTAGTLAHSVEESVRAWIRKTKRQSPGNATQVHFDGKASELPLALCNRLPDPDSVVIAGASFTARDEENRKLWMRTLEAPLTQAEAVDLDGDTENEVVVAVRDRIIAFSADGEELWRTGGGTPVRKFTAAQMFGKKEGASVIAESGSRLAIISTDGIERALPIDGEVTEFVVERTTARHAPRVIVAARVGDSPGHTIYLFDRNGVREWRATVRPAGAIDLEVIDFDNDGQRDIAVQTRKGRVFVNFEGEVLHPAGAAQFARVK